MKSQNGHDVFQEHFNVSRETMERMDIFSELLTKWNSRINLVSKTTIPNLWNRHFVDSAQLWSLAPVITKKWLDIGSGAGFPGLVIAIIAKEFSPDTKVVLVESDTRKAAFLRNTARETGVKVEVNTCRVEDLSPQNADVLSARALAPLIKLLEFSKPHLKVGGMCLFPKGANVDSELTAASNCWHIDYKKFPSITDAEAVILSLGDFQRVDKTNQG